MDEVSFDKVFVHFKDEITNYELADEVISDISGFKDTPGFYSSRYLYDNTEFFNDRKNLFDRPFGIYLENLKFAILNVWDPVIIEELESHELIEEVSAVLRHSIKGLDPDFDTKPNNWGIKKLNLLNAELDGNGVNVAVLDSGIDFKHQFFRHLKKKEKNRTFNTVSPGKTVQDKLGHGTHVAGIIAGGKKDGLQFGVAPKVNLFIVKVTDKKGHIFDNSDIALGIDWARDQNCKVINLSLGFPVRDGRIDKDLQKSITAAQRSNAIVVAAVGNDSMRYQTPPKTKPVSSPANCRHAVAVNAMNESNAIYRLANRQKYPLQQVDFIAPGVKIFSTYPVDLSPSGYEYAFLDGTSMATAFISGLLALYCQGNLQEIPDKILKMLKNSMSSMQFDFEDAGNGLPIFNLPIANLTKINMSHLLDYQGTVTLKSDLGLQEVYSSQNYDTFYSIYISLDIQPSSDPNIVKITNVRFKIVNYKGILNLGIVKVEKDQDPKKDYLEFKVEVRAMERNREFRLNDRGGDPEVISIDKGVINKIVVTRILLPMSTNDFNPDLGPDHQNNAVFDDEFYFRDGLEFDETYERQKRPGMLGGGGVYSGKRCYQVTLKIEE